MIDHEGCNYYILESASMYRSFIEVGLIQNSDTLPAKTYEYKAKYTKTLDEAKKYISEAYPTYKLADGYPKSEGLLEIYIQQSITPIETDDKTENKKITYMLWGIDIGLALALILIWLF